MFPLKSQSNAAAEPKTYPLGQKSEHFQLGPAMAIVALSHTPVEHRLYLAMQSEKSENGDHQTRFSTRHLMLLTGIRSQSTIRRALEGLLTKLSIEREENAEHGPRESGASYRVHSPETIIARRNHIGINTFAGIDRPDNNQSFARALRRVVENRNLSRREAQVALCCVEGRTNAEIGRLLQVSEQTVKFHLRHVFIKFGVKRRAELISRLLR